MSKSAKAKSLLQRVSSRHDLPKSSNSSELSMAPPVPGALSASSSQPSPSTASANTGNAAGTASMEQSVKLFKVFEALRTGDCDTLHSILGDQNDNDSTLAGTTVLHVAVQVADIAVVQSVLKESSVRDLNSRDKDGNTPLHVAAMLGRAHVVKLLLEQNGIDDTIANHQAKTALDDARTPDVFQHLQLARTLFLDSKIQQIHQLVTSGAYDDLEILVADPQIRTTIDVNSPELATDPTTIQSGGSLLHEAARKKDIKLIQMLLLNGADPFFRDRKGKLPQDITRDDRTRAILKKSPAAAAAQRSIQERSILGASGALGLPSAAPDSVVGAKEAREMEGYLKKWTNYTSGYKLRWFVLEDGVLSYYKHQDDAGSACRGAINMRIARLHMDLKDKLNFEIHGKSSVKYHLKANHQVEAKRWFWALNNAIQWSKDEVREETRRQRRNEDSSRRHSRIEQDSAHSLAPSTLAPEAATTGSSATNLSGRSGGSVVGDDMEGSTYEPSLTGADDLTRSLSHTQHHAFDADLDDDDEYADDGSGHDPQPASKDAFTVAANSARLQLDLLAQVSTALAHEREQKPDLKISDTTVSNALASYDTAVGNLRGLMGDLQRISRDHDTYWHHRLDREANMRRLWEDSMARVAKEQEELQSRIGESEEKRKRTKRALRDALGGQDGSGFGPRSRAATRDSDSLQSPVANLTPDHIQGQAGLETPISRKTLHDISDDESDMDDEFFDAIDAGEVEVKDAMPISPMNASGVKHESTKALAIAQSNKGYEDGVRQRLKLDADNRPKVSLWGVLKSMIGKDMTKMTLPVTFNEPTSLLYRVVEDMEYTNLLNIAAEREDSTERMVYVAAFAASEYASTIGRVAKPFNPLLGETFEYVRPDQGYRFFIEQVSHHPPVGAAFAESEKWDYFGESSVKSKFYGKSFEFNPLGTWFLRLRPDSGPEELYTWKKVTSSVVGIITGNPTVDNYGSMEIKNWTTGESCLLDFKARGWRANSAFQVSGRVVDGSSKTCWSIGGRWNDKIYARRTPGGVQEDPSTDTGEAGTEQAFLVWEVNPRPTGIPFNLTPFAVTLNALPERLKPLLPPTDTRLRPDQRAMEDGEYDYAAKEKTRLEEKQRAARRKREQDGEEYKPRWFQPAVDATTGETYWKFTGEYWKLRNEVVSGNGSWQGLADIF